MTSSISLDTGCGLKEGSLGQWLFANVTPENLGVRILL